MTTMTPEHVAGRLGHRPGQRLLTYREVGLPFWDVPLKCRLLARKPLLAVDEFTLRCVEAGLGTSPEIQVFLGLPARVVDTVMGSLVTSAHIVPRLDATTGGLSYALTERGKRAVFELSEIMPEERTVRLAYDGLLHRFVDIAPSLRWRPRDLRDNDILEIPAFPADPPSVSPDDTSSVATAIRDATEAAQQELLAVLGVDGKREKFFVKAIALVFQSVDQSDEITVQFAVDGRLSEEYDHAFAKAEGHRKLGIVGSLQSAANVAQEILGPDVISQLAESSEGANLRRATEGFREELTDLRRRAAATDGEQRDHLAEEAEEVAKRVDEAEAALSLLPVRLLEVHEHPALLEEALATAEERLLIVSPWIRAAVVNDPFVDSLRTLLTRGVDVAIAYGIDDGKHAFERDTAAEKKLQVLAGQHANFRLVRLGDTHAKVLIVDQRFVVVTSYNWLSFRGDSNRPFRDERGTLVTLTPQIDRIYQDYRDRMS